MSYELILVCASFLIFGMSLSGYVNGRLYTKRSPPQRWQGLTVTTIEDAAEGADVGLPLKGGKGTERFL